MVARPGPVESAVTISEAVYAVALNRSKIVVVPESGESIGLDRSVVLELCKTVAVAERSRRKLALNNRSVSTRKGLTLRKRIRPHAHARCWRKRAIAAITEA